MTRKQKKHLARIIAAAVLLAGCGAKAAASARISLSAGMSCGVLSAKYCTVT